MMTIKVAIAGARGRMGTTAIQAIQGAADMVVVAALDYKYDGMYLHEGSVSESEPGIPIFTSFEKLLAHSRPDVLLDVTDPDAVFQNVKGALAAGVRVVVGTSGLDVERIQELTKLAELAGTGVIIAPNFSIGAVLMMKFAVQAARYLGDVEIIEMHHDRKLDAPSGTGVKTAEMIRAVREPHLQGHPEEQEHLQGARGADIDGMKIHSVRLPGLLAHQEVLLGGEGELLTIRHDSFDRKCFIPGIVMAIREVMSKNHLIYGLENIME